MAKIKITHFSNSTLTYFKADKKINIDSREVSFDPKSKNPVFLFSRNENNGEKDKRMRQTVEKRIAVPAYAVKDILIKLSNGDIKKSTKPKNESIAMKKSELRKLIKEELRIIVEDAKKVWKYKGVYLVDSDFVNLCQGKIPNSELKHSGGGNFFLETPDGSIFFDRANGKLDGMSGRAHQITDTSKDKKLFPLLMKKMKAKFVT